MSTIQVDDGDPRIFTAGSWTQQAFGGGAFNTTQSKSRRLGDFKIVHFIGTSISVMGSLEQYGSAQKIAPLVAQFSIDNGPIIKYAPAPPQWWLNEVSLYETSGLTMGEHFLKMENMADQDIIWLDSFIISAPPGQKGAVLQSNGTIPQPSPTSAAISSTSSVSATSTQSLPSVIIHTVTLASQHSSSPTLKSSQAHNSAPATSASGSNGTTTGETMASTGSPVAAALEPTITGVGSRDNSIVISRNNMIIVASASAGALLILAVLAIVIVIVYRRRSRQHRQRDVDPYTPLILAQNSGNSLREKIGGLFESSSGEHNGSSSTLSTLPVATASGDAGRIIQEQRHGENTRQRGSFHAVQRSHPPSRFLPPYAA